MSKVSNLPPSGFRDFLPKEAAERSYLLDTIVRVYRSHGFDTIGVSYLESLTTLTGKGGGQDNEKLIFKILKRGDELKRALESPGTSLADMGLRFDLTLPLARYCSRHREELPKPFKVFQVGPVWRADRPQKGRYREFYQCDLDIVGSKEIGSEVDCIQAIFSVLKECKLTGVELHLNDRRLLSALRGDLEEAQWAEALVILDKLDKISLEGVEKECQEKFGQVPAGLKKVLEGGDLASFEAVEKESFESLSEIIKILSALGIPARFNPSLVRGQDYYTGTIFELRHPDLSGSLGGGGRYNRLLEVFGGGEVPAFGGSIGFERLHLLLSEKGLLPANTSRPDVFFPLFSSELRPALVDLCHKLRAAGLKVDIFPDAAKLKQQFKYADERGIPLTAILGEEEWAKGMLKLKIMQTREEKELKLDPLDSLVAEIKKLI